MDHRYENDAQRDLYDRKMLDNLEAGLITVERAQELADKKGFPKTLKFCKDEKKRVAAAKKKAAEEAAAAAQKAAEEAAKAAKESE